MKASLFSSLREKAVQRDTRALVKGRAEEQRPGEKRDGAEGELGGVAAA
jgi:hypothetical protein